MISNTFCSGGIAYRSAEYMITRAATARNYQVMSGATDAKEVELGLADIVLRWERVKSVYCPCSS